MRLIIDRIEEGIAVCTDIMGNRQEINMSELPGESREGDVLIYAGGGFTPDINATQKRHERIKALEADVFE